MLKLGKIIREKKCKIIQKSTTKKFSKLHLLNGGGLVPAGTLSSGATIINRIDYNIKSTGVL